MHFLVEYLVDFGREEKGGADVVVVVVVGINETRPSPCRLNRTTWYNFHDYILVCVVIVSGSLAV
jgi:hypothetical protein